MKALKNNSYLVAPLVVVFIGIAGGFTNTERGMWVNNDRCSYDKVADWDGEYDPDKAAQDYIDEIHPLLDEMTTELTEQEYCVTHGGVWVTGEKWRPSVKGARSYLSRDSRTTFDPRGTALFTIAGMIIFLVSKDIRGRKKTANDV
jgi:nucleoside phosphorylase